MCHRSLLLPWLVFFQCSSREPVISRFPLQARLRPLKYPLHYTTNQLCKTAVPLLKSRFLTSKNVHGGKDDKYPVSDIKHWYTDVKKETYSFIVLFTIIT